MKYLPLDDKQQSINHGTLRIRCGNGPYCESEKLNTSHQLRNYFIIVDIYAVILTRLIWRVYFGLSPGENRLCIYMRDSLCECTYDLKKNELVFTSEQRFSVEQMSLTIFPILCTLSMTKKSP